MDVIGGIEGGATRSTIVLLGANGNVIAEDTGPATNHYLLGMEECWRRIADMVQKVKSTTGIPKTTPLKALGLSLSGCEKESTNLELAEGLRRTYPEVCEQCSVGSDTDGSIAATSGNGGITCIAGTGSNTLLINPDGSKHQCGGYGYMLGDEGSAWKISHRAIKYCIDDRDGFQASPYPIDRVWSLIMEHFSVENQIDLLEHMYTKFDKAFMASICKRIADAANDGDQLSIYLFDEAGTHLARAISAVVPKASSELTDRPGGIHILCVGSVWFSWNLLKRGFIGYLDECSEIQQLSLIKIKTTIAVGAAYMAVDRLNLSFPKDYDKNYEIFYTYNKGMCNGIK